MTIQSPAPAIHKIVERFIATVTVDEIEFDCYGNAATILDKPEVIQIALHGSPIDICDALSKSKISDIRWACELLWIDGAFNSEDFYRGLNKDL